MGDSEAVLQYKHQFLQCAVSSSCFPVSVNIISALCTNSALEIRKRHDYKEDSIIFYSVCVILQDLIYTNIPLLAPASIAMQNIEAVKPVLGVLWK